MRFGAERLRTALTLSVLLAALTYLYTQATSLYHAQHEKISQELDELLRVDAELARDALRVRTGLLLHFDPLNTALARLGEGVARLRGESERGAYGDARPEINDRLAALARSLAESEERMERFKSASAVARNSLLYLPVLQQELAAEAGPVWQVQLGALANALLRNAQNPGPETAREAEVLLIRISATAAGPAQSEGAEVLGAHARLAMTHGGIAESTLREFLAAAPGGQLRALEETYLAWYRKAQERADTYRTLLYAVSLALLAYLGYLMVRLRVTLSERTRAETLLQGLNQNLEHRVTERTSELRALSREQEAFSYSIAHDLRSPLGIISSYCHLVASDERERLSPEGLRMLNTVEDNVAHLVTLVDALLALAQVGRAQLERQSVELRGLAAAAARRIQPRYPSARLEIGELPGATADPVLITQVFSNLIENALKYSSRHSSPEVKVGWREDEQACYVSDNGVGFDMQHADRLFGAFERLHDGQEYPGSGIGLAIVKRVVERHGGRVWAEAKPGQGATFYFTLGAPPTQSVNAP